MWLFIHFSWCSLIHLRDISVIISSIGNSAQNDVGMCTLHWLISMTERYLNIYSQIELDNQLPQHRSTNIKCLNVTERQMLIYPVAATGRIIWVHFKKWDINSALRSWPLSITTTMSTSDLKDFAHHYRFPIGCVYMYRNTMPFVNE